MSIVTASWYDFPQYYDLAFQGETRQEADFVEAACRKYCDFPVRRLLEPACGTGRVVRELARRGYAITGLDLNERMLAYLGRRLGQRRPQVELVQANMAEFSLPQPVDAAYCLINSFRHLLTEDEARRHLQCVARALVPGGVYLLGLHLLPPDASDDCTERWVERRGETKVTTTLRVIASDRKRRQEWLRISTLVRRDFRQLRLRDEFPLRTYSAGQFRRLLASVPELELVDVFDFWYDLDHPLRLSNFMADAVFILRKPSGRHPRASTRR